MELDKAKYDLLNKYGYIPHFERSLYINRQSKKLFSIVAIEDHDIVWLRSNIDSANKTGTWQVFSNEPFKADILSDILKELGE